jgi:hypothetical protein
VSIPTWEEAASEEFWERIPTDLHEDAVRSYLGANGDAIDARISRLAGMARDLLAEQFCGPSIVASVTALEVMIQYFCIRPIVQGVFLSDLIASEVAGRIIGGRSCDQRDLLVSLLKPWGVDLKGILLPNGEPLWERIRTPVNKARNGFVHRGDDVAHEHAALAIDCIHAFRKEVVLKVARRLGFTLERTACWSKVLHDPIPGVTAGGHTFYGTSDPFV